MVNILKLTNLKLSRIFAFTLFGLFFVIAVAIYPGSGGEGGQREINQFSEKIDWWNFAPAALYGKWPSIGSNWTYTLSLFQFLLFIFSTFLIYRELLDKKLRIFFIIFTYLGAFFVIQLWRDSTLFVCAFLGFAFLFRLKKGNIWFNLAISLILIIIAGLFKPVFAPILFFMLFFFLQDLVKKNSSKIALILACVVLSFSSFLIDRIASNYFNLVKSYPEQQVMIYDTAKIYCWGYSTDSVLEAKSILKPLLIHEGNYESICSSLTPLGWDSLRVQTFEVKDSPSIKVIEDIVEMNKLKKAWIKLIIHSPMEWLMVKVSDSAQVLTMANAYAIDGLYAGEARNSLFISSDLLLKFLHFPVVIFDKLRFFSAGFTILVGFFLFVRLKESLHRDKLQKPAIYFLLINLTVVIMATIAFIANNGRYVLPYILLSYLYLFFKLNLKNS